MKTRYTLCLSAAMLLGVSTAAMSGDYAARSSAIPTQAPDIAGSAGGGPVDCSQTPSDRNCVSMNPYDNRQAMRSDDRDHRRFSRYDREDRRDGRFAENSARHALNNNGDLPPSANESAGPSGH